MQLLGWLELIWRTQHKLLVSGEWQLFFGPLHVLQGSKSLSIDMLMMLNEQRK